MNQKLSVSVWLMPLIKQVIELQLKELINIEMKSFAMCTELSSLLAQAFSEDNAAVLTQTEAIFIIWKRKQIDK